MCFRDTPQVSVRVRPTTTRRPSIKRPFRIIGERSREDRTFLWHVNSLAALMHPSSLAHALPKSGLTLKASYVVSPVITSGPVRLPLRPSPDHLYIALSLSGYPPRRRRRPCGPQILPLFLFHSMPSPLPRVSCRCRFPFLPCTLWPSPKP